MAETDEQEPTAVEPVNGAGLTEDDPPQDGVSQDPGFEVTGDIDAMPEGVV
jgi:hypothetical protein